MSPSCLPAGRQDTRRLPCRRSHECTPNRRGLPLATHGEPGRAARPAAAGLWLSRPRLRPKGVSATAPRLHVARPAGPRKPPFHPAFRPDAGRTQFPWTTWGFRSRARGLPAKHPTPSRLQPGEEHRVARRPAGPAHVRAAGLRTRRLPREHVGWVLRTHADARPRSAWVQAPTLPGSRLAPAPGAAGGLGLRSLGEGALSKRSEDPLPHPGPASPIRDAACYSVSPGHLLILQRHLGLCAVGLRTHRARMAVFRGSRRVRRPAARQAAL
jgi:hypothetical protein